MTTDVIAIDGPAASGKSTVARAVAAGLERLYVDSGALYRGITWCLLEAGVAAADAGAVGAAAGDVTADFCVADGAVQFRMNGRALAEELRAERINRAVSPVSAVPAVRERVTGWLRELCRLGPLVMEGRDIGTQVFPDARWKFYLDASPEERARRRHLDQQAAERLTVEAVNRSLARRDRIDSGRAVAPLRVADDAITIDTTGIDANGVADRIMARVTGQAAVRG